MEKKILMHLFGLVSLASLVRVSALFLKDSSAAVQQTKCLTSCPAGGEIVCGSDGKTYQSLCYLIKEACERKNQVKPEHPGPCDCPSSCLRNYKPVCAVNTTTGKEKTYPNLCQFKRTACQMKEAKKVLAFKRKGPCKKMSKCPSGCQDIFAPVCAADNKTYSSVCALKLASCRVGKKIKLLNIGRCQTGQCPENCPFTYQPICGNDGKWHPSECELKLHACRKSTAIRRVKGRKSKRTCGKRCVSYCTDDEVPVCGSDGFTYGNECKMHKVNCEKGKKVKVAKRSKCDFLSNKTIKKKK